MEIQIHRMVAETVVCLLIGLCTCPPVPIGRFQLWGVVCAPPHALWVRAIPFPHCSKEQVQQRGLAHSGLTLWHLVGVPPSVLSKSVQLSVERTGSVWSIIVTSWGGAPFHCESLSPPYCSWQRSCLMCSWWRRSVTTSSRWGAFYWTPPAESPTCPSLWRTHTPCPHATLKWWRKKPCLSSVCWSCALAPSYCCRWESGGTILLIIDGEEVGRDIESCEGIVVTRKRTRQNITSGYDWYSYNGFCKTGKVDNWSGMKLSICRVGGTQESGLWFWNLFVRPGTCWCLWALCT